MDSRLSNSKVAERLMNNQYHQLPGYFISPNIQEQNLTDTINGIEATYPEMTLDDFYSLNSHGFRSDEFTMEHNNKEHVLFAGCSHTFGQGNMLEDVWAHKLFEYLGGYEELSGYYNVGIPSATYSEIARQVLTYIGQFGCPDKVFILLPDLHREFGKIKKLVSTPDTTTLQIISGLDIDYLNANIGSLFYAIHLLLEQVGSQLYISSNNIYTCEVDESCHKDPRHAVPNFYPMPYVFEETLYSFLQGDNSPHKKHALEAFDIMHDGYAYQHIWYEHFVKILEGELND